MEKVISRKTSRGRKRREEMHENKNLTENSNKETRRKGSKYKEQELKK